MSEKPKDVSLLFLCQCWMPCLQFLYTLAMYISRPIAVWYAICIVFFVPNVAKVPKHISD
ncbi:uncharacterized protein BCR38DRAFT_442130 [Pseudomassariella vexata]|uniref:Uncharacterized protein n=1 Tax=Pseudomassariella vexata TaxID=1141098 RepID=A0A1Y2DN60_9PEZI|nr:uncharacterized protein BCR38DRAFT_442130 [Pseudomassariella vexata]ORY60677.1 hypothetical protein BCR38DRAFT_442130 [Pseudomassariella vexata]